MEPNRGLAVDLGAGFAGLVSLSVPNLRGISVSKVTKLKPRKAAAALDTPTDLDADAVKAGLKFAAVENKAGKFVEATLDGASAAAAGATVAADLTFSSVWATGDAAYPITAQTWILIYENQTDKAKGEAAKAFIGYLLTEGQAFSKDVNYAPLPTELASKAVAQLDSIKLPA